MRNRKQISIAGTRNEPLEPFLQLAKTKHEAPLISQKELLCKKIDQANSLNVNLDELEEDSGQVDAIVTQADGHITSYHQRFQEASQRLKENIKLKDIFKADHGRLLEPKNNAFVIAILTLILAGMGEALLNSLFFMNAHMSASFASAILTSSLISFTNILACALGGVFIGRWLNYGETHIDDNFPQIKSKRWVAHIRFSAFVAVMSFFHLTVGLIRTQEELHFVAHSFEAYRQILHTPEAIFLIITGISLSIIAWHKGKKISDGYGDYGDYQTVIDETNEDLQDAKEEAVEKVSELFDEAIEEQDSQYKQRDKRINKYNQLVDTCNNTYSKLTKAVSLAASQYQSEKAEILNTYQTASDNANIPPETKDGELFNDYLNIELPVHVSIPQSSSYRSQLHEAKAKALEKLNTLFVETDQLTGDIK